jgi:hypothetical protein
MAHAAGCSQLHCGAQPACAQGRYLPQQLTSLTSPFLTAQKRMNRCSRSHFSVSAGAAIPFPAGYPRVSPSEVGRTLLRTTSAGLNKSAELLKRTLSVKTIGNQTLVIQVRKA